MPPTDSTATPEARLAGPHGCRAREVIDLVANKWALGIVDTLGSGPKRFSELRRSIAGISQKMLTANLRRLERDGILTRTVYAVMPPNVTYELTPIGNTLLDATVPLVQWSLRNIAEIDTARIEFDSRRSGDSTS
ncbi:helix-turn-helix domain-containing protein [Amycolatopsis sp. DSM 110486]|uniref:winged helix-turn-helix transcriptional regulator n=1 Tax=Amycolatopsis sp. DSM 110486 TaxID=2865832 RepID=UPI001C6A62F7|nr:helix-turn-helix domain-containing protein [Amycolatopsis sp. DSM 110486]QYN18995.1 helix-turn-helix transcriptional regulator [Amycolatopsis sp. DSM 110486]